MATTTDAVEGPPLDETDVRTGDPEPSTLGGDSPTAVPEQR